MKGVLGHGAVMLIVDLIQDANQLIAVLALVGVLMLGVVAWGLVALLRRRLTARPTRKQRRKRGNRTTT